MRNRGKRGSGRRVIGERRWPLSPRFSPTQPDRIKLLGDGRKYRGSTRSCRAREETTARAWGGSGGGGSERRSARREGEKERDGQRKREKAPEPRSVAGVAEEDREERTRAGRGDGGPAAPRSVVLQLLWTSYCVNVLIQPAWARPIRDTAGHYFACHAIACEGPNSRFTRRRNKDGQR